MGLHTTQFCNTALVKELHSTFLTRLIFSYGDQDEAVVMMIMHHPTQITTQLKYLLTAVHCQFKGNSL